MINLNKRIWATTVLALAGLTSAGLRAETPSLLAALQSNNPALVAKALAEGADPNQRLADGASPLAWAVEMQSPELVELLLVAGARVDGVADSTSPASWPPLLVACLRGDHAILQQLLAAGADVTATDSGSNVAAFALCAGSATTPVLQQFLQQGVDVESVDATGQSALMHAAAAGKVGNIEALLAAGADVNTVTTAGFTPLFFALKSGNPQAAFTLLDAGASTSHIGPEQTSVVQMAMYQQQYQVAAQLIEQGVDLSAYDRNGRQLLHAAVQAQQPQLVALLLRKGADPNALTGESKLTWRYEVNFTSAPYVVYPTTPLLMAAELGNADIMRSLVAGGADIEFAQEDGTNVLLAAAQSNAHALELALGLHGDANSVNRSGKGPLHLLMNIGTDSPIPRTEIQAMFQLLADHGARIDLADAKGNTPVAQAQSIHYWAQKEFFAVFTSADVSPVL
ncbi:ankyrin repeat domain-containing protein [Halioxenophilus aromaticivorans]|uniref:Ankyrin repeat domain-containing protein n=1 Tax=Halioxenophilus aromaticivorans TaxID=1306992 RepID=A0AAV3U4C3_9ALTE